MENNLFSDSWYLFYFLAYLEKLCNNKLAKEYFPKIKEKFSHIHLKEKLEMCESTFLAIVGKIVEFYKNGGDFENLFNPDEFLRQMKKNFEESFEWCERGDQDYERYKFFFEMVNWIKG